MSTVLEITYRPHKGSLEEELNCYSADHWNQDSELELVRHIQQLLSTVRPFGTKLVLTVEVEVTDASTTRHLLIKNLKKLQQVFVPELTVREVEVLALIMQGLTTNEIAERLFICYETVKSHRKHILLKTGAKNTADLINSYHQSLGTK